jgi:IS605 OrfB family transposase
MLLDREKSSTKDYPGLPSVVAKGLINKYQRNHKCREILHISVPISGDCGRQVKLENNCRIRVPALFGKQVIEIQPRHEIIGDIRSVEIFKKKRVLYLSYTYCVRKADLAVEGLVGVDRNYKGNVAVLANLKTGEVRKFGPSAGDLAKNFRDRRAKLQRKLVARNSKKARAKNALKRLSRKQQNRVRDINHKVSRGIVDYATEHCCAIVLEDLGTVRKSKIRRSVQKAQWSYFQLETFIKYKAALRGVPVVYVNPRNTSRTCSKCGEINLPVGKKYKCTECGHFDHRDANAAFNIAKAVLFRWQAEDLRASSVGHADGP